LTEYFIPDNFQSKGNSFTSHSSSLYKSVSLETNLATVLQPTQVHTCYDQTGVQDMVSCRTILVRISMFVQRPPLQLWKPFLTPRLAIVCMLVNIKVDPQIHPVLQSIIIIQDGVILGYLKQGLRSF